MPRQRKPTHLHHAEGTFRPHRHNSRANELQLSGPMPPPPRCVVENPVALATWNALVTSPTYSPTLSAVFHPLLTEYTMLGSRLAAGGEVPITLRAHWSRLGRELLLAPIFRDRWPKTITTTVDEFADVP